MSPKKFVESRWTCKECGRPTDEKDKVCMVCRTPHTQIKGAVAKSPQAAPARKPSPKAAAPIKSADMCDALARALDLELEGRAFYLACAEKTNNKDGRQFFTLLANEEKIHYDKIAHLYEHEDYKGYCSFVEAKGILTGVFEKKVKGGNLNDKSDSLDALNVAIHAEENSIDLYSKLAGEATSEEMRLFFEHLVSEERHHRSMLENEVEFVTGTGDFGDFKIVTM